MLLTRPMIHLLLVFITPKSPVYHEPSVASVVSASVVDRSIGTDNPHLSLGSQADSWCIEHLRYYFLGCLAEHPTFVGHSNLLIESASTPVDLEKPLVKDGDADDVDVHLYRSMIGSLMYLTASRPDIMFAVCACARFQVTPKTSHILAVKRIFRYLKGKPTLCLWYSRDSPFELVVYTDSDYAGATQDRKSTTGGYLLTKGFDAGRFQYLVSRIKTRLGISKEVRTPRYLSLVVPLTKVGDEAVHKELGDRMERAATTASSLEAECQDTILGDVNAQTRFEITSKQSIDPPLSRGYTLGSGEDSMKLIGIDGILLKLVLPVFVSAVKHMLMLPVQVSAVEVLDLQKEKDAQAKVIVALKKRIQWLERRKMSRLTGLKRLRKVGMSRRVESSEDQESLGTPEDVSKQGRSIEDIDADVDVSLVDETQERQDDDLMFYTIVLEDDEMHVEAKVDGKDEQSTKHDDSTAGEAVTTASVVPTTIKEITLAQTLIQIKANKPKVVTTVATTTTTSRPKDKRVVVQEPSEFGVPQETQPLSSKDKGKGIMIEPEVPLKRKDQIALDEQIARDIQVELDAELLEEKKLARKQEEEANITLIESWENTQAMMEADRLLAERL
ncbi:hypothetical protein Tco_1054841 [Tanacetum coccineum]|uniref:Reverse transcriptase Ty1/copia-type domain-containing protein n=1 Tax=Tanacetum coccineum TaxID=301880 RepID=A0ABQ5GYB6_9ASTR